MKKSTRKIIKTKNKEPRFVLNKIKYIPKKYQGIDTSFPNNGELRPWCVVLYNGWKITYQNPAGCINWGCFIQSKGLTSSATFGKNHNVTPLNLIEHLCNDSYYCFINKPPNEKSIIRKLK